MKKSQIELGKTYHNGKAGRFYTERKITGVGPEFVIYEGQRETDNIRYLVIRGNNNGGEGNMTRSSFASWAKGEVSEVI